VEEQKQKGKARKGGEGREGWTGRQWIKFAPTPDEILDTPLLVCYRGITADC